MKLHYTKATAPGNEATAKWQNSLLHPSDLKKKKNYIEPTSYQVNALSVINKTVSQADSQA